MGFPDFDAGLKQPHCHSAFTPKQPSVFQANSLPIEGSISGMKPNQAETEKDPQKQAKTFEQQPPETKELELIKDQAEKASGPERVELNKKIRTNAGQLDKGPSS